MADKKGLERIGLAFGLVTAAVMLIGGMVVNSELNGGSGSDRPAVAGDRPAVMAASIGAIVR